MRWLIVAPSGNGLPEVATEAAEVSNAHPGSVLLQGDDVRERDVLRTAGEGGFDGCWFATHGGAIRDDSGEVSGAFVKLGSAAVMELPAIVSVVKASGARIVLLNSCESVYLGQAIVDESAACVVATIRPVPDREAVMTGLLFARQRDALLSGDFYAAYQRSRPGRNRTYVFLGNPRGGCGNMTGVAASSLPAALIEAKPEKPPRKRGAQLHNVNALKHGFYSKYFNSAENIDLDSFVADSLDDEIAMMRVMVRRVLELSNGVRDVGQAVDMLGALGLASTRLSGLLRTQRLLGGESVDVAAALTEALASVVKELAWEGGSSGG